MVHGRRPRWPACAAMGSEVAWHRAVPLGAALPPSPAATLDALGARARPWLVAAEKGETPAPPSTAPASGAVGGVTRPGAPPLPGTGNEPPAERPPGGCPSARARARCDLIACSASASTLLQGKWGGRADGHARGVGGAATRPASGAVLPRVLGRARGRVAWGSSFVSRALPRNPSSARRPMQLREVARLTATSWLKHGRGGPTRRIAARQGRGRGPRTVTWRRPQTRRPAP